MSHERVVQCAWCGARFSRAASPGRPSIYCRRSHRQRAFEASKRGQDRGLSGGEVLIDGADWASLRDALYTLDAALEDSETDMRDGVDLASIIKRLTRVGAEAVESLPSPQATSNT